MYYKKNCLENKKINFFYNNKTKKIYSLKYNSVKGEQTRTKSLNRTFFKIKKRREWDVKKIDLINEMKNKIIMFPKVLFKIYKIKK